MFRSVVTATGAVTPFTHPTATLEVARKLRMRVVTVRELQSETGAAGFLLGKRNIPHRP
jgi:hypothetical protein